MPRCIHNLKAWPEPFDAVIQGKKKHEFRKDDRGFAVGDYLNLMYFDPTPDGYNAERGFNGRWTTVEVTYLGRGFGIPEGYVCMTIALVTEPKGMTPSEVRVGYQANDARTWEMMG